MTDPDGGYSLRPMKPKKKNLFDAFVFMGLSVNVIVIALIVYYFVL